MSHAASMNLLSFDLLRDPGSVDTRLKWALAGSVAVHVAFAIIASVRFMPMSVPIAPYQVDLVTLADIQAPPTPAPKSQPRPAPPAKPREPERMTDSLRGALESVVVPGPRNVEAVKNVEPVSPPPPVSQPDPPKPDVPRVQSPPQPPQRASAPPKASPKPSSSTQENVSSAQTLAQKLKEAVKKVVVPPLRALPPSAESQQKGEAPVHDPKERKSVKQPSQSVKLREFKHSQETPAESAKVPLIPDPVVVPSQAPTLAKVEQDRTQSRPAVAKTSLKPDNEERENAAIDTLPPIPEVKPLRSHRLTLTNRPVGGSASEANKYWAEVQSKIAGEWVPPPIHRQEPLHVVLAFRIKQTGQVQSLRFVQKSGNAYHDSAVKRAVMAASPLPPVPQDMTKTYCMTKSYCDLEFKFTFDPRKTPQ